MSNLNSRWLFSLAGLATLVWLLASAPVSAAANQPVGTGQGVYPGRVVWAHNPSATSFAGSGNWWDAQYNDQSAYNASMDAAVSNLGGWDAMFHYVNNKRYGQDRGYTAGDKIGIKINLNNASSHSDTTNINANPSTIFALVRSLVAYGVPDADITIGDPSRFVTNNIYTKIHASYPNVQFTDNIGGDGRTKSTYEGNIPFSGSGQTFNQIATMFTRSRYVINLALLKGHPLATVTLCGKNFFGATNITSNPGNNNHTGITPGSWSAFVDYWKHPDLGGKTVLFMIDGMYPTQSVSGAPSAKFNWPPFNNWWPSTLLASQDPVAVDSVAVDIYSGQWSGANDGYLNLAAQANLGMFEHWNNKTDKQYVGIKLLYLCTGGSCNSGSDTTPPSTPGTPVGSNVTSSSVSLSWAASSDNVGVTGYTVYRRDSSSDVSVASPSTNSAPVGGLTPSTTYAFYVKARDAAGNTSAASPIVTVTTSPGDGSGTTISINAGGPATGSFVADSSYSGGSTYSTTNAIDTSLITGTVPPQAVFQAERYGQFTYAIPGLTAGGAYTVTLYFEESYFTAAGQRSFNVAMNGTTVLSAFDIYAAAGGANKAIARTFDVTANASGEIVIQFTSGSANSPKVCGITVAGGSAGGPYSLTVNKGGTGSGTVSSSPAGISCGNTCSSSFASGTSVTLTASAASGSSFTGWSGPCSGTSATCTVSITNAQTVTASFTGDGGPYTLSVNKGGTGSGTVSSSPAGISCGSACSASFGSGTSVTLTASAASGSSFTGWTGACSGTGTCVVTMNAAQTVTAGFGGGGGTCKAPAGSGQSGNFNTTDAVCYSVNATIQGWGCSNTAGRTVSVNGTSVTCGQMPLSGSSPYTFSFTAGTYSWASFYWW